MKLPILAILISVFTLSFCITNTISEEPPLIIVEKEITLIALDSPNPVEATIRHYASEYGVDVETSLRIATCESQMGKYKHNWEGSSATGVYQWTIGTWEWIGATGDRLDDEENIKQFMIWYSKYPGWWECK